MKILFTGFKGKGNSSNKIVSSLEGNKLFLTNSYDGLTRDINQLTEKYDGIIMFGLDSKLHDCIRIEDSALSHDGRITSNLLVLELCQILNTKGLRSIVGKEQGDCLCNEAYLCMLQKYDYRAVFIHVPSFKYITESFLGQLKEGFAEYLQLLENEKNN